MSCIPWIIIPRTARALHAVSLNIYYEGPKSVSNNMLGWLIDSSQSIRLHMFDITLFFIPLVHYPLRTCFKPALGFRVAMFHVLGLVGCSSAASLLLTSTGCCANLVFLQPPRV